MARPLLLLLALAGSGCVLGSTSEEGVRCWSLGRAGVSRTTTRPDGTVVSETCQAAPSRSDRTG